MESRGWGSFSVVEATSLEDLRGKGRETLPDLFVVDPCAGPGGLFDVRSVARLTRWFPAMPILAFPSCRKLPAGAWLRLGAFGVSEVIGDDESERPYVIARRIRRFVASAGSVQVIETLEGVVPARWRALLTRAYPLAHRGASDEAYATRLSVPLLAHLWMTGATRDQINAALRRDGLPPSGWLIRWLISLRAVMLRPARRTWEQVAFELGFGSADALRRFTKRFTGAAPSQLTAEDLTGLFREVVREDGPDGPRDSKA
jgi:AraC-like DNA-binding protein